MNRNSEPLGFTYSYRDFLWALVVVFIAIVVVAQREKPIKPTPSQGRTIFTLHWDRSADADVDLWVKSPGDATPVGYSRPTGKSCDLVRDDLGRSLDPSSRNEEMTICRYAPAIGEWVVNVMLYHTYGSRDIAATVSVLSRIKGYYERVLRKRVKLHYNGQQITLFRFRLTKSGALEPFSVNDAPIDLYKAE